MSQRKVSSDGASGASAGRMPVTGIDLGQFEVLQPLSSRFHVPSNIEQLVAGADRDISRGRLESALDLTLAAEVECPGFVGLYVRQAELLIATGRFGCATNIARTVADVAPNLDGPGVEVELERIITHADPTDENVLHLAHSALNAGRHDVVDRYLPVAVVAASLQDDPSLALDLARRWFELKPESLDAAFSLTRESLRLGDDSLYDDILEQSVIDSRDARSLVVRIVLQCARQRPEQWDMTAALLSSIESHHIDARYVQSLLREMIAVQPTNESLLVHSGVLEVNAGNPEAAFQLLSAIRPADPQAYYVAVVACARAALACGNVTAADDALRRALDLHQKHEMATFAAQCPVLQPPHDLFSIGKMMAGTLQQRGDTVDGTALLERLTAINPSREDLSRAYADMLAKSGKREVAIARLEEMLRTHEQAGDRGATLLTIQSILQISPGNLRLRNRLIDEYMKRGMLQEAVQERWTQAQILERAGRIDDAVEQIRSAAEAASVLGDWKKVESIVRMMIRMRPEDLNVRHSAATKFIEFGQIKAAIEQLWAVVDIATRSKDPDEAIAALHQIIALGPEEVDAYHRLGEVLASVGEFAQAERVYRRLEALVPDDPSIVAKQSALAAMARGGS